MGFDVIRSRNGQGFELEDREPQSSRRERADDEVDLVVAQIRRICNTSSLEFALSVGRVIIHHFYHGDTNAWRVRGPKTTSFRRLAEHPDLPMSAGTLYRCVAVFELCDRLHAPSRWEHLSASHLRTVLGLPPETQETVLSLANAKRWSVKMLGEEVKSRNATRSRGGRKAQSSVVRGIRALQRCLESHEVFSSGFDVEADELTDSLEILESAKNRIERLRQVLEGRNRGAAHRQ